MEPKDPTITPIDKQKEEPTDQTAEKLLVTEILTSLEESQLTVRDGISRDGFRRTPYRSAEATVAGHKVQLLVFGKSAEGEKRLKIDGQEFNSPEIIDRMELLTKTIAKQRQIEGNEKDLAKKNLMADISDGLETATITMRSATEFRGNKKIRLNIYEGEIAGHKIKLTSYGFYIDDQDVIHTDEAFALIPKIKEKAQTDTSIAETRKKIEDEPST